MALFDKSKSSKYQKHRDSRATVKLWQDMDKVFFRQTVFLFGAMLSLVIVLLVLC